MDWKEKLGLNPAIKDPETSAYLKQMGFKESIMNPSYLDSTAYYEEVETLDRPCLYLQKEVPGRDQTFHIYINDKDAYMEKTGFDFEGARFVKVKEAITMENIDSILDELI